MGLIPGSAPGRTAFWVLIFALLLVLAILLSLGSGRYPLRVNELPGLFGPDAPDAAAAVFWNLRLPRVLLAILAGAALAVSGAATQAVFRNPLVSPFILGVSSGASFGAALAYLLLDGQPLAVQGLALAGGLVAALAAWLAARLAGGPPAVLTLVLAGIVVSSFFQALVGLLKLAADPESQLPAITFWMMGGLDRGGWSGLVWLSCLSLPALILLFVLARALDLLSLGAADAAALGLDPRRYVSLVLLAVVIATTAVTAVCGVIGWIGLIVPHAARRLVGPLHVRMLPVTVLLGAILLLVSDTLARSLTAGEIPVGLVTSILGAPFFLLILRRGLRGGEE